jgi:4-diphosphocytidyl-2-C-methyl-D-erythritol kinase
MQALTTRARAKVNLTLHVLGRRDDGYHDLESLVAFAGVGDTLTLVPGHVLDLTVEGPLAEGTGPLDRNLVIRAARALAERIADLRVGSFHLVKRLPAAAGIGGGSADAAAALRLLARLNRMPLEHPALVEAARITGADVPVCLASRMRMMRGAGEVLGDVLGAGGLEAVLVNPGVPVATAPVFAVLGLRPGERNAEADHPDAAVQSVGDLLHRMAQGRNDLEAPAIALAPEIGEALEELRDLPGCRLARMSGSGGTVFAVFNDAAEAGSAARAVRRRRPNWWVRPTRIG